MRLMFARIPLMLVEGEEAPSEMKLITVDNGLVRRCRYSPLPSAMPGPHQRLSVVAVC